MRKYDRKSSAMRVVAVIAAIILVVLVMLSIGYFYLFRPGDNDIQAAESNVSTLKNSISTSMPKAFGYLTRPGFITSDVASSFSDSVKTYRQSLAALDDSPAITRSSEAHAAYDLAKSSLMSYGGYLQGLSVSVSIFDTIRTTCDNLTKKLPGMYTRKDYDKDSKECAKAIDDGKSAPNNDFSKQFLNDYRESASSLFNTMANYFSAYDAKNNVRITETKADFQKLSAQIFNMGERTIVYSSSSPSTDRLDNLLNTLGSLKSRLIR